MMRLRLLSLLTLSAAMLTLPAQATAASVLDVTESRIAPSDDGAEVRVRSGFGTAVAAAGDLVFVGNPGMFSFFPMPPNRPGMVNVFRRGEDGSTEAIATLESPAGQVGDGFGTALAAAGNWLVVGAPGAYDGAGAAYLYRRSGDDFELVMTLGGSDPEGAMGTAVALGPNHVYVGAPGTGGQAGAVHVVDARREGSPPVVITPDVPVAASRFGASISAQGDEVLVGAPGPAMDPFAGPLGIQVAYQRGSAYLFDLSGEDAAQTRVFAPETETPEGFGWSVMLAEQGAFMGAPLAGGGSGMVYGFHRTGETWAPRRTLPGPEGVPAGLGMSLAWAGDQLLAGAPMAGRIMAMGAGPDGEPAVLQELQGAEAQGFFGASMALSSGSLIVGAPGESLFAGVGYLFARSGQEWEAAGTMVDAVSGPMAITGDMVECDDGGEAAAFPCGEVDLVAFLPVQDLGAERGIMVNDVWGWTDPETGREYALVGRNDATVFVDITNAGNPAVLGELPLSETAVVSLWRDMKVYDDHMFVVADAAGAHGIQVFDLTQLRGLSPDVGRVFAETARYDGIFSAHNIVINEDTGFAYVVGASMGGTTCGGGLHMVDIRDPANPTFAGCFQDNTTGLAGTGYSHDAQCVLYSGPDTDYAGREICFGANENALSIADVTDKSAPVAISTARYPNSSYLHQGWVSQDQAYFFMNDEGDEIAGLTPMTRTLVWDIRDLDDPILLTEHQGTTAASDHNLYVRDNLMYQSNYVSGLRILDVSDPANPVEIGYFDTVPQGENAPGFAGSWSNYPFFESGTILVTSVREGLFLVKRKARRTVFQD